MNAGRYINLGKPPPSGIEGNYQATPETYGIPMTKSRRVANIAPPKLASRGLVLGLFVGAFVLCLVLLTIAVLIQQAGW